MPLLKVACHCPALTPVIDPQDVTQVFQIILIPPSLSEAALIPWLPEKNYANLQLGANGLGQVKFVKNCQKSVAPAEDSRISPALYLC